jgi:hypothetical protein
MIIFRAIYEKLCNKVPLLLDIMVGKSTTCINSNVFITVTSQVLQENLHLGHHRLKKLQSVDIKNSRSFLID